MNKAGSRGLMIFFLLLACALAWYSPDWQYRRQIVIDGSELTTTVEDYPIIIRVSSDVVGDHAKPDFSDVIFVWYNSTTGQEYQVPQALAGIWETPWYYEGWQYRKKILIHGVGTELFDYQVRLNIAYETGMNSDFSDLRFTWLNGSIEQEIPYWIEKYEAGNYAVVWIKVPEIPASGDAVIYMYYGNSTAVNVGNATNVFIYFEDFEDGLEDWSSVASSTSSVIETTTEQAYTGQKSLLVYQTADDGDTYVYHDLGVGYTDVEIIAWFYDNLTVSGIIGYFVTDAADTFPGIIIGVKTDLSTTNYVYRVGSTWYVTNVSRSNGWHEFRWYTDGNITKIYIDGIFVANISDIINFRFIKYGTLWTAEKGFFADTVIVRKKVLPDVTYTVGEVETKKREATFYVKIPIIRAGSSTSIFMYYGNPNATGEWNNISAFRGVFFQSGKLSVSDFEWKYVQFERPFPAPPLVFATLEYVDDYPNTISVRVANITQYGFYVRAEKFSESSYATPYYIYWIAIANKDITIGTFEVDVDTVVAGGDETQYQFDVDVNYTNLATNPIIHQIQTMNVDVPGLHSRVGFNYNPPVFRIEECTVYGGTGEETIALASFIEGIHWIGNGVVYVTHRYMQSETVQIDYPFIIPNSVVISKVYTLYGGDPVVMHVEYKTDYQVYVELAEPPCPDGSHTYEYVSIIITNVTLADDVQAYEIEYYFGAEETAAITVPKIYTLYLLPEQPQTADDLTCTVALTASVDNISFYWYVNGNLVKSTNTTALSDSLSNTYTKKNDVIICRVEIYYLGSKTDERNVSVTIYNTPPTLPTVLEPTSGIYGGMYNIINITCSGSTDIDNDALTYYVYALYDGDWHSLGSLTGGYLLWDVSNITSQSNVDLYCIAYDGEDYSNIFNPTGTFTIDNTKPRTYSDFDSSLWYNSPQYVNIYCDDNIQCNVTYYCIDTINTCDPTTVYNGTILVSNEGINYIRTYSMDEVGNLADLYIITVRIDYTPPEIVVFQPNETKYKDAIPINISVTDNFYVSKCWAEYGGVAIEIPDCKNATLYGPEGTDVLYIYAEDAAGNIRVVNMTIELEATRIYTGGGGGGGAGPTYVALYIKVPFVPKVPTYFCTRKECIRVDEMKGVEKYELTFGEYLDCYLNITYKGRTYIIKPYDKYGFKTSLLIDVGKELGIKGALYKQKAIAPKNKKVPFPHPTVMLGLATILVILSYILRPIF